MGRRSGRVWAWSIAGGLAGAAGLVWLIHRATSPRWTWGRPPGVDPWGEPIYRDPSQVSPGLADKVETVISRLHARGYDAVVAEAYRAPARAAHLSADTQTGIADSIHSYGGAVDIVHRKLGWSASQAFKDAVVEEVERAGLTSGRRFSNRDDWAHAQAIPVKQEYAFRHASLAERNRMAA